MRSAAVTSLFFVFVCIIGGAFVPGTVTAQDETTRTVTPTPEVCTPTPESPEIAAIDMGGRSTTVDGAPGEIGMSFTSAATARCDTRVQVVLRGETDGLAISGFDGPGSVSGVTNTLSSTFTVPPEGGTRSISAEVYATEPGEYTFEMMVTYWPEDHPELAFENDGSEYTITVAEPVTRATTPTADDSNPTGLLSERLSVVAIGGLVLVTSLLVLKR